MNISIASLSFVLEYNMYPNNWLHFIRLLKKPQSIITMAHQIYTANIVSEMIEGPHIMEYNLPCMLNRSLVFIFKTNSL